MQDEQLTNGVGDPGRAADRIAYWLVTHPGLSVEGELLADALEDLSLVAPENWKPPADPEEARRRWEASWNSSDV